MNVVKETPDNQPLTLHDCLKAYFKTEQLSGSNAYFCNHCKTKQPAHKSLIVDSFPLYLCIHFLRFNRSLQKLYTKVTFPLSDLNLSEYEHKPPYIPHDEAVYDLYAVVCHAGTFKEGHYTAYARDDDGISWRLFNDSHSSIVDPPTNVKHTDPYILFYRRRNASPLNTNILAQLHNRRSVQSIFSLTPLIPNPLPEGLVQVKDNPNMLVCDTPSVVCDCPLGPVLHSVWFPFVSSLFHSYFPHIYAGSLSDVCVTLLPPSPSRILSLLVHSNFILQLLIVCLISFSSSSHVHSYTHHFLSRKLAESRII